MTEPTTIETPVAESEGLHKAFIRSLSQIDRDRLGHMAGVSGSYVTSLVYRNSETVSLGMAIAIDKFSKGKLDFRDLLARKELIDWDFVADRLNEDEVVSA